MSNVDGLYAIAIVDRDGVPLMKCRFRFKFLFTVLTSFLTASSKDSVPDLALRPHFLASGYQTIEQSGKLGMGRCQAMICEFEQHQVISFNHQPYTVSLIASRKANTGHLLSLEASFVPVVEELSKIFE